MSSHKSGAGEQSRGQSPTSIVSVRLTKSEREALSVKADQAQLALSAFIRACAMSAIDGDDVLSAPANKAPKAKRLSSSERTQIALIIACMGRLMDTVRELEEEPVETSDQPLMLACLKREIRQTRDECFVALRRKP